MSILFHTLAFIVACFFLVFSGRHLIDSLSKISRFLNWKEFVVAFFLMALGVSLPNFFVGITSAFNKIPQLSLGDIIGGNIIDLSIVVGLAALVSRGGLTAASSTVQETAFFTVFIAILPLLLISDMTLSRFDGIILILAFIFYTFWLFSKKDRFTKIYGRIKEPKSFGFFLKNLGYFFGSFIVVLLSANLIVASAKFFASYFSLPLTAIGIFIIGLGNSLPEMFFSLQAARKGEDWLMLGDIMGGVIITATLVLGIVSLICPIKITNFSEIAIGRGFLALSAIFFLIFIRSGRKITKREGIFLVLIYIAFLTVEILF